MIKALIEIVLSLSIASIFLYIIWQLGFFKIFPIILRQFGLYTKTSRKYDEKIDKIKKGK